MSGVVYGSMSMCIDFIMVIYPCNVLPWSVVLECPLYIFLGDGSLLGGFSPTHLKNMRKSKWVHLPKK